MKITLLTLLLMLGASTLSYAGSFTINTNALEDAAIQAKVDEYNLANGTSITPNQAMQAWFRKRLDEFVSDMTQEKLRKLHQKYLNATPEQKQQVDSILGVN